MATPYRSRPDERPACAGNDEGEFPALWILDQVQNDDAGHRAVPRRFLALLGMTHEVRGNDGDGLQEWELFDVTCGFAYGRELVRMLVV